MYTRIRRSVSVGLVALLPLLAGCPNGGGNGTGSEETGAGRPWSMSQRPGPMSYPPIPSEAVES